MRDRRDSTTVFLVSTLNILRLFFRNAWLAAIFSIYYIPANANSEYGKWMEDGLEAAEKQHFQEACQAFNLSLQEARRQGSKQDALKSTDNLAWTYTKLANYAKAEKLYKTILVARPSRTAEINLANVYFLHKRYSKAARIYKRILNQKTQPEDGFFYPSALRNYAEVSKKLGDFAKADELMEELSWLEEKELCVRSPSQYVPRSLYYTSETSYLEKLHEQFKRMLVLPLDTHGRVKLRFTLSPSGEVQNLQTENQAGDLLLERCAIRALKDASPFPPLPKNISTETKIVVIVPSI